MLITHTHQSDTTSAAVAAAVKAARERSVELIATKDELEKHGDAAEGLELVEDGDRPDVCVVLGGDGSILYALRRFANTEVPVFGINFGTIGFLAAVEREQLNEGLQRAFSGDFEVIDLPALRVDLSASSGVRTGGWRCSPTRSETRRLGTSAATAWWRRPRRDRRATTSPTQGRSWPGG
jgi:NAD kinase